MEEVREPLEKDIEELSDEMDKFDKEFENLEVEEEKINFSIDSIKKELNKEVTRTVGEEILLSVASFAAGMVVKALFKRY